jgi:hypothetical protein
MTSLFFGAMRDSTPPADEKVVRSNTYVVRKDSPAAAAEGAPEWNEQETDHNPDLGMVNRQVASFWHQPEQSVPFNQSLVDNADEHNAIVDRQISTSGTAASREASGKWGHGTAAYAIGIEPVKDLTDGGALGNDYFLANNPGIQDGMGRYMLPNLGNGETTSVVAAAGKDAARDAHAASVSASLYNSFLQGS